MPTSPDTFDARMDAWRRQQAEPWMQLRYRIARANLAHHLEGGSLCVLDVGGGNGADALPLAADGHQVTIADYSPAMLADAREAAKHAGLGERLAFLMTDLATLPTHVTGSRFDLVLFHNVIQYVDDGAAALAALARLLRPGGLLSLLTPNPVSEVLRAALIDRQPDAALAALDASVMHTTVFDVDVRRYPVATLEAWLHDAGLEVVAHYGVRCVNDYIPGNELKYDSAFMASLEQLELALSGRDPYRQIARGTHLVARRRATQGR